MGIVDRDGAVKVSVDSTFMKAYSRRGRKGGLSDRGARVGKTDRRNYALGWRAHTVTSMSALPLTYIVRAAKVNDKDVVKPLLRQAPHLLTRFGKRISHVIADRQYYSTEVFAAVRRLKAEPVIPYPSNVKDPKTYLIELHGPYKWYGHNSLFLQPESEKLGIYLWTIPFEEKYLVYYVGETGISFANRLLYHTRNYLHGLYRVYDPKNFVKGKKILIWEGMWKKELEKPTIRIFKFLERYSELSKAIYDFLGAFRVFLIPFNSDRRTRQRIEAAIAETLLKQPSFIGDFQDGDIRYIKRQSDEEPIQVLVKSGEQILGLPKELMA
jgi:hypothetical protein